MNPLIFGDQDDHRDLVAELFTGKQVTAGLEGWRRLTDDDRKRLADAGKEDPDA